jgi:hypothetical protein
MDSSRGLAVALVAALALAPGCVARSRGNIPSNRARSIYLEEGPLVSLIVSTRATRFRLKKRYVPLEVAVVNQGLEQLTLTRASFTLTDSAGNLYPAMGPRELSQLYGNTGVDRRYAEAPSLLLSKFATYQRHPSNFSPSFDAPLAQDKVSLAPLSYLYDFLYFPRPAGDLVDQPLDLVVSAPELGGRATIRFRLEG